MTRIALDTNILAYLVGVARVPADAPKVERVGRIVETLASSCVLVAPVQTLGELYVVLGRSGRSAADARDRVIEVSEAFASPPSAVETALAAADLTVDHGLHYWAAMILTAAVEAGCAMLLSEDMQDGFVTRGLTIVNPLAEVVNARLAPLIG